MRAERQRVFDAARRYWSPLTIGFDQFCGHLGQLGYIRELPLHVADVYLCVACGLGNKRACQVLETKYFPGVRTYVSTVDARADTVEDVLQGVRDRLLVGPKARILTYGGRGSFQAWLCKVARNVALDYLRAHSMRRRTRARLNDFAVIELLHPAVPTSPEDAVLREREARLIQGALSKAISNLPTQDRRLLYHYFVCGLCIDDLGRIYSIDRSTAARRISRNLRRIRSAVGTDLLPHMGRLEPGELERWGSVLQQRADINASVLLAG